MPFLMILFFFSNHVSGLEEIQITHTGALMRRQKLIVPKDAHDAVVKGQQNMLVSISPHASLAEDNAVKSELGKRDDPVLPQPESAPVTGDENGEAPEPSGRNKDASVGSKSGKSPDLVEPHVPLGRDDEDETPGINKDSSAETESGRSQDQVEPQIPSGGDDNDGEKSEANKVSSSDDVTNNNTIQNGANEDGGVDGYPIEDETTKHSDIKDNKDNNGTEKGTADDDIVGNTSPADKVAEDKVAEDEVAEKKAIEGNATEDNTTERIGNDGIVRKEATPKKGWDERGRTRDDKDDTRNRTGETRPTQGLPWKSILISLVSGGAMVMSFAYFGNTVYQYVRVNYSTWLSGFATQTGGGDPAASSVGNGRIVEEDSRGTANASVQETSVLDVQLPAGESQPSALFASTEDGASGQSQAQDITLSSETDEGSRI